MSVIRLGETMDMEAKIPNTEGEPHDILISKIPFSRRMATLSVSRALTET
jgi:hypothetical protein